MNTLRLNKQALWVVRFVSDEEILDGGLSTGEYKKVYSKPEKIFLNMFSGNSSVIQETFGARNDVNLVCSDNIELNIHDLLCYNSPECDVDMETQYDYKVTAKFKSINHNVYGFKGRLDGSARRTRFRISRRHKSLVRTTRRDFRRS